MGKVNDLLLRKKTITQEQHDKAQAKEDKRKQVKDDYKANKGKLTLTKAKEMLDELTK